VIEQLQAAVDAVAAEDRDGWSGPALSAQLLELLTQNERLEAEIVRVAAQWDGVQAWAGDDALTPAAWLVEHASLTRARANRLVRSARLVRDHEQTADALASGAMSCSHVEVLADATKNREDLYAEHEAVLVEAARTTRPEAFRHAARYWRSLADDALAATDAYARFERRHLHASATLGSTVVGDFELDADGGSLVLAALDAADTGPDSSDLLSPRTLAQRRADALVTIAEHYLGCERDHGRPCRTLDLVMSAEVFTAAEATDRMTGRCSLEGVGPVARETAMRIACDASIARAVIDGMSEVLNLGRRTPAVSPVQRRAVLLRDETCLLCDRPGKWCDVHHLVPYSEGGRTDLDNLVLLCRRHHVIVHEGGWTLVRAPDGTITAVPP
jgi:hypothetical protein